MTQIRNIAIIAHVDHGKTTLTDKLMEFCGSGDAGSTMDTNDLEKERGITIYAKNTSVNWKGSKINIVDTPGHADFGSEVERVLKSIDSVLLLVDAQEGPMPQTRFVLKKSLELGLKPIVVLNKIDKPAANPGRVHDEVLELFMELGANDDQLNFPYIYAIGREGVAMKHLDDERKDLAPLLDMVIEHVPNAVKDESAPLQAQVFSLAYDSFLGRLGICRVYAGSIKNASTIHIYNGEGNLRDGKITKISNFQGVSRIQIDALTAGDIGVIAGIPDITIGESIVDNKETPSLGNITIDEPTISLRFLVNDSPFAGREGKFVTSRQIRERLERELEVNVGLRVEFLEDGSALVYGRGELHVSVLLETMRREGFEVQVSKPEVIIKKDEAGHKTEPFEEVTIDVPTEFSGAVLEKMTRRRGMITNMMERDGITRLSLDIPTRGLLGYRSQFVIDTKGLGIIASRFSAFKDYVGEISEHDYGSMTSMITGKAVSFALWNLEERGTLYVEHGVDVYEGMVIGNTMKGDELAVNPVKGKQLTNMRASGTDEAINLKPPYIVSIERGLEIMKNDEYLEITPKSVRLRKKFLTESERSKNKRHTIDSDK
jgi:GTP-binding protein